MANNEHINKVVKSTGETLIDLTSDTVTAGTLLKDVTAHDRSGAQITGTAVIPTVNDGTLTIQQNGATKATFTANQSTNATVNIETGDAYGIDIYDDTLPIDITARGDNLEDWVIYGNNEGVGEYDAESGGYILPITVKQRTINLYNKDAKISGYRVTWITGNLISWQNGQMSDYIPIEQSNYRCTVDVIVLGYDSNKAYLGVLTDNGFDKSGLGTIIWSNSITINDSNAKYIKLLGFAMPETASYSWSDDMMLCEGDTIPSAFVPYEYTKTSTIYLGTSPLTEGQSLSKAQATTKDIPTFNGECTIDTSYPNKPKMEIIPTDSAINIINKLKGCMPLSGGNMTGTLEWGNGVGGIEYVPSSYNLIIYNMLADNGRITISSAGKLELEGHNEVKLQSYSGNFVMGEHLFSMNLPDENSENLQILRMTYGGGSELVIDGSGYVGKSSSSRDIKHDIQYIDNTDTYHNALMQIKPATYVYNNDKSETAKLGMIAEDIADVMPIAALTGEGGKVENYDTRAIITMLVMEVQRLNAEIERLRGDSDAD